MYVTRRRNRVLRRTNPIPLDPAKSNPSKRHRERLNGELEYLASLLPFEGSVIAKLDKLSILRLAVSYLKAKNYFQAIPQTHTVCAATHCASDSFLKALNGFVLVVDSVGEVFYVSETVEQYLGFHQSDILHQSVLELVHSEDREALSQQLNWRHLHHAPDFASYNTNYHQLLQRSFMVRFRCLLDNTSGFMTMEVCGQLKQIYGTKGHREVAMFALCTPFGPLPLTDRSVDDVSFRSKHKLDMQILSLDLRGKALLGDLESKETGMYSILHPNDLIYFANAHAEMLKTGSCGLVAYRVSSKDGQWLWLQTSARVVYRNSKPDYIMCFHRNLTEEEGYNLIGKRNVEITMPQMYTDAFVDEDGFFEQSAHSEKLKQSKKCSSGYSTTPYEPSLYYIKDHSSMQPNMYSMHGFYHSNHCNTTPFYTMDARHNVLEPESASQNVPYGSYYVDYIPYATTNIVSAETSRYHHPLPAVAHANLYATIYDPPCLQAQMFNCSDGGNTRRYPDARYHKPHYPSHSALLKSDLNCNPLLSFTDMTFPLLNPS